MAMIDAAGTYTLGDRQVRRMGYGAMQLAGPGVFGPPRDRAEAIAVLRAAVEAGVNHIDTSDFYGPHVTNQIIREALHPYPEDLVIVTKVAARRDAKGAWLPALSPPELRSAVEDNLRNLGLEQLEVVNLRSMHGLHGPAEGPLEEQLTALAEMQREGLIRHVGLSNVTRRQIEEARRILPIVCVQNAFNLVARDDEPLIHRLSDEGIPYVPFFPLGGFSPLQSTILNEVAEHAAATPMQIALAWLLRRSPNILLIPGTSSRAHLRENLDAAEIHLSEGALAKLELLENKVTAEHR
jgi:pyridoxine 4-dehydrogenase